MAMQAHLSGDTHTFKRTAVNVFEAYKPHFSERVTNILASIIKEEKLPTHGRDVRSYLLSVRGWAKRENIDTILSTQLSILSRAFNDWAHSSIDYGTVDAVRGCLEATEKLENWVRANYPHVNILSTQERDELRREFENQFGIFPGTRSVYCAPQRSLFTAFTFDNKVSAPIKENGLTLVLDTGALNLSQIDQLKAVLQSTYKLLPHNMNYQKGHFYLSFENVEEATLFQQRCVVFKEKVFKPYFETAPGPHDVEGAKKYLLIIPNLAEPYLQSPYPAVLSTLRYYYELTPKSISVKNSVIHIIVSAGEQRPIEEAIDELRTNGILLARKYYPMEVREDVSVEASHGEGLQAKYIITVQNLPENFLKNPSKDVGLCLNFSYGLLATDFSVDNAELSMSIEQDPNGPAASSLEDVLEELVNDGLRIRSNKYPVKKEVKFEECAPAKKCFITISGLPADALTAPYELITKGLIFGPGLEATDFHLTNSELKIAVSCEEELDKRVDELVEQGLNLKGKTYPVKREISAQPSAGKDTPKSVFGASSTFLTFKGLSSVPDSFGALIKANYNLEIKDFRSEGDDLVVELADIGPAQKITIENLLIDGLRYRSVTYIVSKHKEGGSKSLLLFLEAPQNNDIPIGQVEHMWKQIMNENFRDFYLASSYISGGKKLLCFSLRGERQNIVNILKQFPSFRLWGEYIAYLAPKPKGSSFPVIFSVETGLLGTSGEERQHIFKSFINAESILQVGEHFVLAGFSDLKAQQRIIKEEFFEVPNFIQNEIKESTQTPVEPKRKEFTLSDLVRSTQPKSSETQSTSSEPPTVVATENKATRGRGQGNSRGTGRVTQSTSSQPPKVVATENKAARGGRGQGNSRGTNRQRQ
jgi:hypothetical protein